MLRRPLSANQRLSAQTHLFNDSNHKLHNLLNVFNFHLILFQKSFQQELMNFLFFHSQFHVEEAWNLLILKLQEIEARVEFLDFFYNLISEKFVTLFNSPETLPHMNTHTKQKFTTKYNETRPDIEKTLHQIFQTARDIKSSKTPNITGLIQNLIDDTSELCTHYHLQILTMYKFLGVTNTTQMEQFLLPTLPLE